MVGNDAQWIWHRFGQVEGDPGRDRGERKVAVSCLGEGQLNGERLHHRYRDQISRSSAECAWRPSGLPGANRDVAELYEPQCMLASQKFDRWRQERLDGQ